MPLTYLLTQLSLLLYMQVGLDHFFPDQYPQWYLLALWAISALLRWFAKDFENSSIPLMFATGFIYGFASGMFLDITMGDALTAGIITFGIFVAATMIAEFMDAILVEPNHWIPSILTVLFNVLLLANLYLLLPLLTQIDQDLLFLLILGFSSIVFMAISGGILYGADRILKQIFHANFKAIFFAGPIASGVVLSALITTFSWLTHPSTAWTSHLLVASIISYLVYGTFALWLYSSRSRF